MRPSVQLYSLRHELAEDPVECLTRLKQIGVEQIEGYDLTHLRSLKPILDDLGLDVCSSFLFWPHISGRHDLAAQIDYPWMPPRWGIDYEIEQAHALGLKTVVNGFFLPKERQTLDDFKRLTEALEKAGQACRAAGLQLSYHNHCFEFEPHDGVIPFDYLHSQTSAEALGFELDTLWAASVGRDVPALMRQLGPRLTQLHAKDGELGHLIGFDHHTVPETAQHYSLGQGQVGIAQVLEQARAMGLDEIYVEQEYAPDIYSSLSKSLSYLAAQWEAERP